MIRNILNLRFAIFVAAVLLVSSTSVKGQTFDVKPQRLLTDDKFYLIGSYSMSKDSTWHYEEKNNSQIYSSRFDYVMHFFAYDKKHNKYYFYSDNLIGYCIPYRNFDPSAIGLMDKMLKSDDDKTFGERLKHGVKQANVPLVTEETVQEAIKTVMLNMAETYEKRNSMVLENKRKREDAARKAEEERQERELRNYRLTHNWRSPYYSVNIQCLSCKKQVNLQNGRIISIYADTLFFTTEKPTEKIANYEYSEIHYAAIAAISNDKFKKDMNIWHDSIAKCEKFTSQMADAINASNYAKFSSNVKTHVPYGYFSSWGWEKNIVDGIEIEFSFVNTYSKTLKYIDFSFSVYNAVGDICRLKLNDSTIGKVRGVGPIEPMETGHWNWDKATHYTTGDATEMKIVKVVLTYMDGSTKTLTGNMIITDD